MLRCKPTIQKAHAPCHMHRVPVHHAPIHRPAASREKTDELLAAVKALDVDRTRRILEERFKSGDLAPTPVVWRALSELCCARRSVLSRADCLRIADVARALTARLGPTATRTAAERAIFGSSPEHVLRVPVGEITCAAPAVVATLVRDGLKRGDDGDLGRGTSVLPGPGEATPDAVEWLLEQYAAGGVRPAYLLGPAIEWFARNPDSSDLVVALVRRCPVPAAGSEDETRIPLALENLVRFATPACEARAVEVALEMERRFGAELARRALCHVQPEALVGRPALAAYASS